MEIRAEFHVEEKRYQFVIEKGIFRIKGIYLHELKNGSQLLIPVPIKISASTRKEVFENWLWGLKRYLVKKRCKEEER